ncbi:MAG TPA: hypothetical protein DEA82_15760 [Flavobacteriaceae bacterium]|nr:hypothetical protein [Flavobacteriaceae bacterium]HBR55554.1 hypothetical protein [Flavobacteriaceae bacterium]|tara:strand:- start:39250 stop:39804 length:555 start_codon:yes stop_codon:yes gene_type:complete
MKYTKYILFGLSLSLFVSCKDAKESNEPETVEVETANDVTQDESKKPTIGEVAFNDPNMAVVFREYIAMKDAMVATNAAQTAAQGSRLMTAFANMGVDDSAMKAAQNVMEAGHMDKQREAFVELTAIVEEMLEGEVASGTIYKQYCPMAFNNTGASWLSASSDIMNPYFGDKMLRCGRIEGKIE